MMSKVYTVSWVLGAPREYRKAMLTMNKKVVLQMMQNTIPNREQLNNRLYLVIAVE